MDQKPNLTVIDGGAEEPAETPETPAPPAPTESKGISILDVAENYAGWVSQVKKQYHLAEGNVVRLLELAWNAHFTSLQLNRQVQLPGIPAPVDPNDPGAQLPPGITEEDTEADGSEA